MDFSFPVPRSFLPNCFTCYSVVITSPHHLFFSNASILVLVRMSLPELYCETLSLQTLRKSLGVCASWLLRLGHRLASSSSKVVCCSCYRKSIGYACTRSQHAITLKASRLGRRRPADQATAFSRPSVSHRRNAAFRVQSPGSSSGDALHLSSLTGFGQQ